MALPLLFLIAAFGCTILESITVFDRIAQTPFFRNGVWIISKVTHANCKFLLYTSPKIFIGIVGGICFFLFLVSFCDEFRDVLRCWRNPFLIIFSSIVLVPLVIASIKAVSGVYSPIEMLPYGGKYPHIGLIEQLWKFGVTTGGRSFPAGHASGGFSLMALYYLPMPNIFKRILFCFGFISGWIMGLYQMARGEHFLSHTLTSMFLALTIITMLSHFILKKHI